MKLPSLATSLCLLSTGVCLTAAWQVHSALKGDHPPMIETVTRTVNGKTPIVRTVRVDRQITFDGDQITNDYIKTIRGNAYLVTDTLGSERFILYSRLLQDIPIGTKLAGWFVVLDMTTMVSEGKCSFIAPLELGSIVNAAVK